MTEEQDNTTPDTGGRRSDKGGAGKLIAVVIVLTLLAILLVPSHETDQVEPPSQERPSLLGGDEASKTLSETTDSTRGSRYAGEMGNEGLGPGAAARRLIRELRAQAHPDLDRAYKAAQEFQAKGALADAYLLYFYAAREGHGPAALELAHQTDPSSFDKNSLFDGPDELQANKWYVRAEQAGVAEASEALARLRSAVEKRAQAGDARARRIMLQWK